MSDTVAILWPVLSSSLLSGLGAGWLTYLFTLRREREADWRKMKFEQYQEFTLAFSGIIEGRNGDSAVLAAALRRYADAYNSMQIIASPRVLEAMIALQSEISEKNANRDYDNEYQLVDRLFKAMRSDIHPKLAKADMKLLGVIGTPKSDPT
ncbi:hypothetical protein [Nitrospirillum viridazoti]|uniref:hypothetical protein n=1 Tax=Nitrospirillum viridazoti TaxID=3144925 RepID=UPI0011AA3092|nr:hypothetical protein [Nitrospirillum amazonense]